MIKRKIVTTIVFLSILVLTLSPQEVDSAEKLTLRILQNNYAAEKAKYDENQKKINLTQSEINSKKNRIQTLKNEMNTIIKENEKLAEEIEEYKLKIKDKIIQSKGLVEQLQMTEKEDLYYDYIFNADSVSDMVYRSAVIKEIVEYNEKTIDTLNSMIEDNKKREAEIEKRKAEIDKLNGELNTQVSALGEEKDQLSVGSISITKQMQEIQSKITYYKNRGCKLDDVIGVDCDKMGSGQVRRPTTTGYVTQNNAYNSSGLHRGLDIGSSNGSREKIYAVADGTIMGVEKDNNGALMVRIDHIIGGKHYTSLYGHLSSFRPGIYRGMKVTSNDWIGYMGNTGYSFGIHLHIEMYPCWLYSDSQCLTFAKWKSFAQSQYNSGYNIRKIIPVTSGLYNRWYNR